MYVLDLDKMVLEVVDTDDTALYGVYELLKDDGTFLSNGYVLQGRKLVLSRVPFVGEPFLIRGKRADILVDLRSGEVFETDTPNVKGDILVHKGIAYSYGRSSLTGKERIPTFELPDRPPYLNWQSIYMSEEERGEMDDMFFSIRKSYDGRIPPDQYVALSFLVGLTEPSAVEYLYNNLLERGKDPLKVGFYGAIAMEKHEVELEPEKQYFIDLDPDEIVRFLFSFDGVYEDPTTGVFLRTKDGFYIPPLVETPNIFVNTPLPYYKPPEEYVKWLEEIYREMGGDDNFETFVILLKMVNIRRGTFLLPPIGRAEHLVKKYTGMDPITWMDAQKSLLDRLLPSVADMRKPT